jgi:hypothetical protein
MGLYKEEKVVNAKMALKFLNFTTPDIWTHSLQKKNVLSLNESTVFSLNLLLICAFFVAVILLLKNF